VPSVCRWITATSARLHRLLLCPLTALERLRLRPSVYCRFASVWTGKGWTYRQNRGTQTAGRAKAVNCVNIIIIINSSSSSSSSSSSGGGGGGSRSSSSSSSSNVVVVVVIVLVVVVVVVSLLPHLRTVFTITYLTQALSLRYTVLQLFCIYSLRYM